MLLDTSGGSTSSNLGFWYNLYSGRKLDDGFGEDELKLAASNSNLEADWGYVLGSLPKAKRRKENCGSSSNGYSTSDLSEALSSISAALSLSSSDSDQWDGDTNGRRDSEKRGGEDQEMLDLVTSSASIPYSQDGDANGMMISFSDGYSQNHAAFEICGKTEQEKFQALPAIGMEFFSEEEAYLFYKRYAEGSGFRVRKGKVQRAIDGTIRKRYIFCSRQGFRSRNQLTKDTKFKRKETRTGCKAQICCTAEDRKWVLTHVSLEHNHELLVQHKTRKTRSLDGISTIHVTEETEMAELKARNTEREDSQSLQNWFGSIQMADSSFSYELMLYDNDLVSNVFWTEGASKMNYYHFGDVLILDTTSKTDRHGRNCTLLWGVNNNYLRYTLFGCALLVDESTNSFTWLFESFFKVMGPIGQRSQLKTIVTDEKQSVADAVKAVFSPNVQHQIGIWHIRQSASKNLSGLYDENPGFRFLFEECISGRLTREGFESRWGMLMERFVDDLGKNPWLNVLYRSRERWAHKFSEKTFWAGTQHNMISSSMFQGSGNSTMDLESIVWRYLRFARKRRRSCTKNSASLRLPKG